MKPPGGSRKPGYFQPRFWPTWVLLGALRSLAQLPFPWQMKLGRLLGWVLYHGLRRRRLIAARNIELCLPLLSQAARARLLQRHFYSLGQALFESASAWWGPLRRLDLLTRIQGLEHLGAAKAAGRGVIVVSGHFTTIDMCLQIMSRCAPGYAIYRRNKNPLFNEQTLRARSRSGGIMFEREDMRTALKALRDNQSVWFSPDQDHGLAAHAEFVPFFGIQAATVTTTARLAARTGAAVVPLLYRRLPAAGGYELCLLPALEDYPGEDLRGATRRINSIIEAQVLLAPEQYLWVHRRFKTRPPAQPPVYEQ